VVPPFTWAGIRVVTSALFLNGALLLFQRKHPPIHKGFFASILIYSLLGIIINQACFLTGLSLTTATNGAILNTLIPVFTLVLVSFGGREVLTRKRALGFGMAFLGVLFFRRFEEVSFSNQTFLGDALITLNCVTSSVFLVMSKKFLETHDSFWTTAWMFSFSGVGLTMMSSLEWSHFQLPHLTPQLAACALYSIFGSTLLAYFLNIWALTQLRSSSTALFIYLQPIIASSIAWLALGEVVTLRTVISSMLIFAGMVLIPERGKAANLTKEKPRRFRQGLFG
jgi:drug/metabolite transporter (DMT)-like permease